MKYTKLDMENALMNIRTGQLSVINASKKFKIPSRTLYSRIKKIKSQILLFEPEIIIETEIKEEPDDITIETEIKEEDQLRCWDTPLAYSDTPLAYSAALRAVSSPDITIETEIKEEPDDITIETEIKEEDQLRCWDTPLAYSDTPLAYSAALRAVSSPDITIETEIKEPDIKETIDTLERQINDEQIQNKSELFRQMLLIYLKK
jgi:hypothetical protein